MLPPFKVLKPEIQSGQNALVTEVVGIVLRGRKGWSKLYSCILCDWRA